MNSIWTIVISLTNITFTKIASHVRLFSGDCLLYKAIKSVQEQINFQKELGDLQIWADKWAGSSMLQNIKS